MHSPRVDVEVEAVQTSTNVCNLAKFHQDGLTRLYQITGLGPIAVRYRAHIMFVQRPFIGLGRMLLTRCIKECRKGSIGVVVKSHAE